MTRTIRVALETLTIAATLALPFILYFWRM